MEPLFQIPEDLTALSEDELRAFIAAGRETAKAIAAKPSEFISDDRSKSDLSVEMKAGVAAVVEAQAELAKRETATSETEEASEEETTEEETTPEAEAETADAEEFAALAAELEEETVTPEAEAAEQETLSIKVIPNMDGFAEAVSEKLAEVTESITASAGKPRRLPRPSISRSAELPEAEEAPAPRALVAALEFGGHGVGEELDADEIARIMVKRRNEQGDVPEGTHGDKVPMAKASWSDEYPEERKLSGNIGHDMKKIAAVVAAGEILERFEARRKADPASLVAAGGLCAPVTPYYNLQMVSVAERPVRAALPAFNADRGGIRFAAPATLASITTGVGRITAANDALGGTNSAKTCQVISCPPFSEVDVAAIFHCLQFGNLGARAFPELVAQWNALTLAAHARKADGALLSGIRTASTLVTASDAMILGASAQLPSQILTAAAGMRSRHRMDPEAVLRVLLPNWVLDLLVSDVYRTQFGRFEMGPQDFVALLRDANVEPSFYIDEATGRGQIHSVQSAGALDTFPTTVEWYLYPEGSFLFVDGGTLELGLVRDSVLNSTNDFQIFGESWENVAFIGVESLAVTTTVGDFGAVTAPHATTSVSYS